MQFKPFDDPSVLYDLESIRRRDLVDDKGVTLTQIKKELTPKFGMVWRDIILGYIAIFGMGALVIYAQKLEWGHWLLNIVFGGLWMGYFMAYLNLFMHEASHYNIHPNRDTNDTLANLFICILSGQHIKNYRIVHWNHHRDLGTTTDSEHSYFDPLNWKFILESLTGIKAVKTMFGREKSDTNKEANFDSAAFYRMLFLGGLLNLLILSFPFYLGYWQFCIAWVAASLIFFPLFGALRQLLEHRDELAKGDTDYSTQDHGKISRMFRGAFSRTMGGAGFNRHLLHHWEPNISYTRLKDLEQYIRRTQIGWIVDKYYTSYPKTFAKLFNA